MKKQRTCVFAICKDNPEFIVSYFTCRSIAVRHLHYLKKKHPDLNLFVLQLDVISKAEYKEIVNLFHLDEH